MPRFLRCSTGLRKLSEILIRASLYQRMYASKAATNSSVVVDSQSREKHFVVVRVIEPEPPSIRVEQVELEAVHSRQVYLLHWRQLTDASLWRQGWV